MRELFDDAQLFIYYRDDRPFKNDILRYVPNMHRAIRVSGPQDFLPLDYFDTSHGSITLADDAELRDIRAVDILLAGNMYGEPQMHCMPLPTLRAAPDLKQRGDEALLKLGVDPSRWIAAVYWKEAGYGDRGFHGARVVKDPIPYLAARRYIIENLGGQVVRLGHPSATETLDIPGFFDLAKLPDSHWLQMHAVSVSRFMIASASGPSAYGPAFDVPTAVTDQIELSGVWRDHDYIVTRGFYIDGKEYRQMEAYEAGHLDHASDWGEYGTKIPLRPNSIGELLDTVDEMYAVSGNCPGWRVPSPGTVIFPKPNSFTLPAPRRQRPEFLIPPSKRSSKITPP